MLGPWVVCPGGPAVAVRGTYLIVALVLVYQVAAALNPLSIQANNQTCLFISDCPTNRFCLAPPYSALQGVCLQCWRCCLYPAVYGTCPPRCNCNPGSPCAAAYDCGQGTFCATTSSSTFTLPSCQLCSQCGADVEEVGGQCSNSCPSGALGSATPSSPAAFSMTQRFIFLAFLAKEVAPGSDSQPGLAQLSADELRQWLAWEQLPEAQAGVLLHALGLDDQASSAVPLSSWISALQASSSSALACPTLAMDTNTPRAGVVFEGCPCNATARAAAFRCPAGTRCSRAAFKALSSDVLLDPTGARLQAVCVACEAGQFCPEGTFVKDEGNLLELDCPQAAYCPTPAVQLSCPAGSYCVERTVEPLSCDFNDLLQQQPFKVLPQPGQSVIKRMRDQGDPLRGNLCPVGSSRPTSLCAEGYYCPNTSTSLRCPASFFCPVQSIEPRRCSVLTSCPEGTGRPRWSSLAFVLSSLIAASLPLLHWLLRSIDSSSTHYEDLEHQELKRSKALKATRALLAVIKGLPAGDMTADARSAEMLAKYGGFGWIEPRIRLDFHELGLTLAGKGMVLAGVSGFFPPGKMHAVMGPSGSGKTTFLNVLSGKAHGAVSGTVFVNGASMPLRKMRHITGFVPQDDIVHEDLSVRENLSYAAHLRLPRDLADAHRRAAVIEDALDMLQLRHIQHYRVGSVEKRGISGGQRKRVNIGLELVSSPSVLFLDEPTSGLDATASNDILTSLADMAALGMSVIAVIHQPRFSSFMLFDQVLLLGHGGHTVFVGPPGVAVLYFHHGLGFTLPPRENPADVLMDILGGKVPREGNTRYKPGMLPSWWTVKGHAWVQEFEELNQGHKASRGHWRLLAACTGCY
ncbi:hypothetical protein V8C86DRAFT_1122712 [Haematococcus lacustris]